MATLLGLLIWVGISAIIGGIISAVTGIEILFWVVSIFLFILGLPGLLIGGFVDGFIQDKIDYVQDREDYRQIMHDIAEDERQDRYIDAIKNKEDRPVNYQDNRQIHFHVGSDKINHKKRT